MKRLTTILAVLLIAVGVSAGDGDVVVVEIAADVAEGPITYEMPILWGHIDWQHDSNACQVVILDGLCATNGLGRRRVKVDEITAEDIIEGGRLTNVVTRLVEDWHVCAVIGHRWDFKRVTLTYDHEDLLPDLQETAIRRYCLICGKEERITE